MLPIGLATLVVFLTVVTTRAPITLFWLLGIIVNHGSLKIHGDNLGVRLGLFV